MQTLKNIFTDFSRLLAALVAMLVIPVAVISQPSVRMHNITGCSNTEILIPIEAVNMQNIAALTLFIKVDTSTVEYVGVEDVNEAFSGGDFVGGENQQSQLLTVNWFSLTPASIDSGLICNIRVVLKRSSCNLLFSENCELVKPDLTTVNNVEYIDGSILALGSYVPDPLSQSVIEGSDASISLTDVSDGLAFKWQQLLDDYWADLEEGSIFAGVDTPELELHSVSKDMNEDLFRCLISNNVCTDSTVESELYVTPNGIGIMHGNNRSFPLEVYPNPTGNSLNCKINTDINNGKIVLTSSHGVVVKILKFTNVSAGNIKTYKMDDVKSGEYTVSLFNNRLLISSIKVIRK